MALDVISYGAAKRAQATAETAVPRTVRRAVYCNGGQGQQPQTTLTETGIRLVVRLPVATTRWRVRVRNYNSKTNSPTTQATLSGVGIVRGTHASGLLGIETGNFAGGVCDPIAGAYTIPGDGTFWQSAWITDPALQFEQDAEYVLGTGFTAGSSTTIQRGTGQCFVTPTAAAGIDPSVTASSSPPSGIPLDLQIEYETLTDRKVVLVIGDSITEGQGGSDKLAPWYLAWPRLWASKSRALVVNLSQSGTTTYDWSLTAADRWGRVNLADMQFDAVVVALGANDAHNESNLGTYQSFLRDTVTKARQYAGTAPLYLATVTPRGYTSGDAKETSRTAINGWVRGAPLQCMGVVDFDYYMADRSDATLLPAWMTTDGTHMSRSGMQMQAGIAAAGIGTMP